MKAALISMGSISSKLTATAMKKYFEHVDEIDIRKIEVNVTSTDNGIMYEGKSLADYDCVYIKGSFRFASLQRSISSILENRGNLYQPIRSQAYTLGHDKLLTHLELQKEKIPMPKTFLSATPAASKNLLKKMNFPIILKIPHGTQGKGVMFADSFAAASSMLDTLTALKQPFIIQEYVETEGSDIRALVVGDKVVAAFKRKAQKEEKRANIHVGGKGEPIVLDEKVKNLALRTAKAIGADICAIDILEGPKEPLVIEVNLSPGLQGIMKATNIDVPDKIAKFLFDKTTALKEKDTKTKKNEIMTDLGEQPDEKTIIDSVNFRGSRILIPESVSKLSKLHEKNDAEYTVKKGEIKIKLIHE